MNAKANRAAWLCGGRAAGSLQRGRICSIATIVVLAMVGVAIWYAGFRPADPSKPADSRTASG
ncbi:hypothetical protein, partial [Salmonella sp. SAL4444]|uniref:hypothetical protein n=1 Tax=Salmonella sp. SAL4444 TaxID=3159899 RepID=UPI00397CA1BC